MRILVVGAGATSGYFGGRLLQAGRNVTFLVRPRRAEQLRRLGLSIRSVHGDFHDPAPPLLAAQDLAGTFDLVILSPKAHDLDGAIESFAKAVGPGTAILPLMNGMRQLDALADRFGAGHVLGGLCMISTTLGAGGAIVHLNDLHALVFGELDRSRSPRIEEIAAALIGAGFEARRSDAIRLEMWEKWMFIATAAGMTCLMRAAIGEIAAAGAADSASDLLDECAAIASHQGFPPRREVLEQARGLVTAAGSPMTASMLRDIENGLPAEGDHILGDLLRRAERQDARSLLRLADLHLKAYEVRRTGAATAGR